MFLVTTEGMFFEIALIIAETRVFGRIPVGT